MGRQVIGQNAEYPKLRNLFVFVIAVGIMLTVIRLTISNNLGRPSPKEAASSLSSPILAVKPKRTYRSGLQPKGIFVPKLVRSDYNFLPLVDLTDRGDFLFLASPSGADYRQYVHVFNGKSVQSERTPTTERWAFSPSGNIIKRKDLLSPFQAGRMNGGLVGWAFNEIRFFRRFTDDGSLIYINNTYRKKHLNARLIKDKSGVPSKVYYTSGFPLSVLEIDDKQAIWLKESLDIKQFQNDRLMRCSEDKVENISFPAEYKSVDRVSVTGSVVAATFGNALGIQPFRSFVRSQSQWKELPIPSGFVFSFVQKVLNNGMILGFVTDENREKMQQVVWKGDSVAILNELPSWPKLGQFSLVTRANRIGDLYVRSVLNTETGASENYLLNVGL